MTDGTGTRRDIVIGTESDLDLTRITLTLTLLINVNGKCWMHCRA